MQDEHYLRYDDYGVAYWLEPEYTTMSRGRPCKEHRRYQPGCPECQGGIGRKWYEKYETDVFPSDEVPVPGQGVFKKVPRYYEDILANSDPKLHQAIKKERQKYHQKNADDYTTRRLEDAYKVKKAQIATLHRPLE